MNLPEKKKMYCFEKEYNFHSLYIYREREIDIINQLKISSNINLKIIVIKLNNHIIQDT